MPSSKNNPGDSKEDLADFLESDPRYKEIQAELSDKALAERREHIRRVYGLKSHEDVWKLAHTVGDYPDQKSGKPFVPLDPQKYHEVFEEKYPEDYKKYIASEKSRVYDNPSYDPAVWKLQKTIEDALDKYHPRGVGNDPDRWFRSQEDIAKLQEAERAAYEAFISEYPEKAEAYRYTIKKPEDEKYAPDKPLDEIFATRQRVKEAEERKKIEETLKEETRKRHEEIDEEIQKGIKATKEKNKELDEQTAQKPTPLTDFELRPGITNYDVYAVSTKEGKKANRLIWQDKNGNIYSETVDEHANNLEKETSQPQQKAVTPEEYEGFKKGFVEELKKGDSKVESGLYFSFDAQGNPILTGGEKPPQRIYLTFKPTVQESGETIKAKDNKRVKEHFKYIEGSGLFDLDPVTFRELKDAGVLTDKFKGEEFTTALRIYSQGGKSDDLINKVTKANFLTPDEKESLYRSSYILSSFEESEKELTKNLQTAFKHPEITIEQIAPKIPSPEFQALPLERKQEVLSPIVKTAVGETVGVAKSQVKKLVVQSVKKEGKKAAAKLAIKTGVNVLAGVATGGVGSVVMTAIQVAGIALSIVKKAVSAISRLITGEEDPQKRAMAIGALIMFGGLALANYAVVVLGGGLFATSYLSYVGAMSAGSQAMGFIQSLFVGVITTVVAIFTLPIIITLVTVILFFILTVFIINNSAFVVPPHQPFAPFGGPLTNPYIGVNKSANPSGPLPNNQTHTVTYTVTITALQGALTNISFSNTCSVYASYARNCPTEANVQAGTQSGPLQAYPSIGATVPQQISPTNPYVVTYEVTYTGGQFNDSLISDTFTVTATEPSGTSQTSLGVVSVIIGAPPSSCFVISDNASSWNSSPTVSGYRDNLQRAINRLTTRYSPFVAKVCSAGTINLCYDPPAVSLWGYHTHTSACDIKFDSGGLTREDNATYILTHEASHHLDAINGTWFSQYSLTSGAPTELPLCSYPATTNQHEGFAEGNALYVQLPSFWGSRCGNTTFQSRYPLHYNFANTVIFR